MNSRVFQFIQENKILSFSFIFFALFSTSLHVFATPPTSPYGAGDTLDPSCAPGDTYCYVGGVSFFNYGDNGTVTTTGLNTFLGITAGNRTMGSTATEIYHASYNTAMGYNALLDNTTGFDGTAMGVDALANNTTGYVNTAFGKATLFTNTTGFQNVALGGYTMLNNTTGSNNTAIGGRAALWQNTTGSENTAIGYVSLGGNTTASYNTGLGSWSGTFLSSGTENVFLGHEAGLKIVAGSNMTTADNSIFIGHDTRPAANSQTNQIVIGYEAQGLGSNTTVIGNSSTTLTNLKGAVTIGTTSTSYQLQVGNSSVSGIVARFENSTGTCDINPTTTSLSCSSDETLKTNIETLELDALEIMNSLRPVTYNWKTQADQESIPGFIAQEIETQLPKLVNTDPETGLKSLNYTLFTPYIIKSIQELDTKVSNLMNNLDFTTSLKTWLASATNGIETLWAQKIKTKEVETERLCIDDVCINKDQLQSLLSNQSGVAVYSTAEELEDEETILEEEVIEEETIEEEIVPEDTSEEIIEEEIVEEVTPEEEVVEEEILVEEGNNV